MKPKLVLNSEDAMPSYQLAPLDLETMTTLYLYGKLTPPE
jgi:hypothetical protein